MSISPGHGQVGLPEAQLALPREVRVADEQATLAAGDAIRTDGPGVAARIHGREQPGRRRHGRRRRGVRRLGRGDVVHQPGAARQQGDRPAVGVQVLGGDRLHPRLTGAPSGQALRAGIGELEVPAGGEGLEGLLHLRGDRRPVGTGELVDADRQPGEVAVDVGVGIARSECRGASALHLEHLVGERAGVVLTAGVALAEDHVGDGLSGDVRDAVRRPADRRFVRRPAGAVAIGRRRRRRRARRRQRRRLGDRRGGLGARRGGRAVRGRRGVVVVAARRHHHGGGNEQAEPGAHHVIMSRMPFTLLLCTDGSELADEALADGLAVCRHADRVVVATVIEAVDPMLAVGTGMAGGVLSATEVEHMQDERLAAARRCSTPRARTCDWRAPRRRSSKGRPVRRSASSPSPPAPRRS